MLFTLENLVNVLPSSEQKVLCSRYDHQVAEGHQRKAQKSAAGGCLPHSEQFSLASGNNEMGRPRALGEHPATVYIMDIHRGEFCLHQGDHVREL